MSRLKPLCPATSDAGARCQDKNVSSREDTFCHLDEQANRVLLYFA
jgi:hypothetical protein